MLTIAAHTAVPYAVSTSTARSFHFEFIAYVVILKTAKTNTPSSAPTDAASLIDSAVTVAAIEDDSNATTTAATRRRRRRRRNCGEDGDGDGDGDGVHANA